MLHTCFITRRGTVLRDTFNRVHDYVRVSLTERCNLRCQYCMPDNGVPLTPKADLLTTEETIRLLRLLVTEGGCHKIRFTGGEPLLRGSDLLRMAREVREAAPKVELCVTTNGLLLPRFLAPMYEAGVTSINVSLDSLQEDRFAFITRRRGFSLVMDSIAMAERLPGVKLKVNCVVMRGFNEDELGAFAALTMERRVEVRFIEFMPFEDNHWSRGKVFSFMEMMDTIEAYHGAKLTPVSSGAMAEQTAKLFKLPHSMGSIGFISPVTLPFCSTCNRLRLTADGKLRRCLFDADEHDLRPTLRNSSDNSLLLQEIQQALQHKKAMLGGHSDLLSGSSSGRPMISIGG